MCANGINGTILQSINNNCNIYGFDISTANDFLKTDTNDRNNLFELAKKIVENIAADHNKNSLSSMFMSLYEFEKIQRKNNNQRGRDHIIHSVTCFFLGIYINEEFLSKHNAKVDPFEWKLASLFHDISYPLEIDKNKLDYFKKITEHLSDNHDICICSLDEIKISYLRDHNKCSLKLIDNTLQKILYNNTDDTNQKTKAINKYNCALMNGNYCHGIFSSLTVLYIAAALYNRFNPTKKEDNIEPYNAGWNYKFFKNEILNSCTAIFLHNFKFITPKMTMEKSECAYLLKLCDALQNWNRPHNKRNATCTSPKEYYVGINSRDKLCFTAPKKYAQKIRDELNNTISMNNIIISSAE
ncbi:hypothetical protein [Desulfolutivibrio sulfoxidireducens]|uniref:hypothetical protein n=1 Tax=Desulfolutivibrio sulfoxidireducens TaxID=2773299 RepID=UPI00159D408E|nr:hypothetical protein [Desulfolutivibrio sulfoxidireducens]QLA15225.1 hypothetical protein GD605_03265 [Desulfolutivibrio sulfoxidireducens]